MRSAARPGSWPAILGSTVLTAVATAGVALVIAAFIARRAYATVTIFAVFIVPGIIVAVIIALELGPASRYVVLLDVGTVLDAANAWFFGVAPVVRGLADRRACPSRSASSPRS